MFGYNNPTYSPQNYYTPQPYQQRQTYPPAFSQPMMQDGAVQARLVAGKEEAVAATVIPGTIVLFFDRAHGTVYSKFMDPQTGMPEFREYVSAEPAAQPATPQYATVEMLEQLQAQIDERLSAFQNVPRNSKKGGTVDE